MVKKSIYVLDITDKAMMNQKFVAIPKPRTDTIATLEKMGAKIKTMPYFPFFNIKQKWKRSIIWRLNNAFITLSYIKNFSKVKDSVIFIQYPFTASFSSYVMRYMLSNFSKNSNKIIILFHDLESMRLPSRVKNDAEKSIIESADVCIFHSKGMIDRLNQRNFLIKKSILLEFFDYRNEYQLSALSDLKNIKLIFAGNLVKSTFLKDMHRLPLNEKYQINLYGKKNENLPQNQYIHYQGVFAADDIASIQGNWGLVWDGKSINTCSGEYGEYLRVNSPFKFSLYLASNRPVIVWKHSAMSAYVEKYHLGICVESLYEIPRVINSLSDQQINLIISGVAFVSQKVRNGDMLTTAIKKSLDML